MNLEFNIHPGMHERSLQRRVNNPLFDAVDVTQSDLISAQLLDSKNLEEFLPDFNALIQEIATLSGQVETEKLDSLKESLDKMYTQCGCLPGEIITFKQSIRKLIGVITAVVQSNSDGDPMAMQKLEDENASRLFHYDLQDITVISDITHAESPVTEGDLIATLLGESTSDLEKVIPIFSPEQLHYLQKDAEKRLTELREQGYDLPLAWNNLACISNALENSSGYEN